MLAEVDQLNTELHERRTRVLGPDHPDTIWYQPRLAVNATPEERMQSNRDKLARLRRALGDGHPWVLEATQRLAQSKRISGDRGDRMFEEEIYRQMLQQFQQNLGESHRNTLECSIHLAGRLHDTGKVEEAERLLRSVLERAQRAFGREDYLVGRACIVLALKLETQNRYDEASVLKRQYVEYKRRAMGDDHRSAISHLSMLGQTLAKTNRGAETVEVYQELFDRARWHREFNDGMVAMYMSLLGPALVSEGRHAEAELPLKLALERFERAGAKADHPDKQTVLYALAEVYERTGRHDEATRLRNEAKLNAATRPPSSGSTTGAPPATSTIP